MKKIIALLLSALLLFSAVSALCEETVEDYVIESQAEFDITVDAPAGYDIDRNDDLGIIDVKFLPDDPAETSYELTIAYSDDFEGYTMPAEPDEAMKNDALAVILGDYADPSVTYTTTSFGTGVIMVDEQGSESEYGMLLSIWQGYFANIYLESSDPLTEADFQRGLDIMSSLQVVEKQL